MNKEHILKEIKRTTQANGGVPLGQQRFLHETGIKKSEFNDIPSWAERCRVESAMGAEILLLTPAAVGSNWFSELVAGYADVYLLKGRLSFIPGQPYNKDCMLSHYRPRATLLWSEKLENRKICVWDWKCDRILYEWSVQ